MYFNFFKPRGKESTEVRKSQIKGKEKGECLGRPVVPLKKEQKIVYYSADSPLKHFRQHVLPLCLFFFMNDI